MINYYKQIDTALQSYENYKPFHTYSIDWICNKIDWAYRWKKITKAQMGTLVDRIIAIMEEK